MATPPKSKPRRAPAATAGLKQPKPARRPAADPTTEAKPIPAAPAFQGMPGSAKAGAKHPVAAKKPATAVGKQPATANASPAPPSVRPSDQHLRAAAAAGGAEAAKPARQRPDAEKPVEAAAPANDSDTPETKRSSGRSEPAPDAGAVQAKPRRPAAGSRTKAPAAAKPERRTAGEAAPKPASVADVPVSVARPAAQPTIAASTADAAKLDAPAAPHLADSFATPALADALDRATHAAIAMTTQGLSPAALALAFADWAVHLAASPGKQLTLVESAFGKWAEFSRILLDTVSGGSEAAAEPIEAGPNDRRFRAPEWRQPPFSAIARGFLMAEDWWMQATTGVNGIGAHHEQVVEFAARQLLDMVAPPNFPALNPEVLKRTLEQGGANLVRGLDHLRADIERSLSAKPPEGAEAFRPGETVAVTPGRVVYRNRLIELIQYAPTTETVRPEPVLIVPAWIMKYYILDLSPSNSLVRHLVDQGFTVFMISWKNVGVEDRDLGMEDYRKLGIEAAMAAIGLIVPNQLVHATGYCLGGTLLSIAAAAEAQHGHRRFASVTLLAAETDFHEAGELMLFIDESQLDFIDDMMWERGYLDTKQMAGAFQMLRSNDLIWSRMVREYLLGEPQDLNDLMAWNADATRLPYRMHSDYLKAMFLNNDLAEGRYRADGQPISIGDIQVSIFAVGTETDHVAPWRSVFKITLMADTDVTFVLTSGGHNAGIVSEPGHHGRSFRIGVKLPTEPYVDPDRWFETAETRDGSWWPAWFAWLAEHSGALGAPPPMAAPERGLEPLGDAPGSYVLMP